MNPIYWLAACILSAGFRLLYRFRVHGKQHIPARGAILAPNHNSLMDPPLMMGVAWPKEMHFLAHTNLFKSIFRWILKGFNAHPTGAVHSFRTLQSLLADGKRIVIFPEGGISKTGDLLPFHTGMARLALRMRCPIVPVYISGTFKAWPRSHYFPRFGHSITCVFGRPIQVDPYLQLEGRQASEALTAEVRQAIERLQGWLQEGAQGEIP